MPLLLNLSPPRRGDERRLRVRRMTEVRQAPGLGDGL